VRPRQFMSFPVESFWKLVVESQLLSLEDCHQFHAAWVAQNPQGDAAQLAEWLVAQNVISRYQASILLAGRAGPFVYGDYKIYDRIESGRLKGIFRALHMPTMHTVCLQFLKPEQAATPDVTARLAQQAALVSRTSAGFPHLLRCYHLVDLGTFKFFVLEDLQGKRVERILAQKGPMTQSEACRIARQAALGLARLHGMQQAHGDVRPSTIWVDSNGTVKLLQFPLATDPTAAPVDWRRLLSTADAKAPPEADFIAPEIISGARPDARSDIYELGCSLYTMLTNTPPFPAKSLRDKLEGHLRGQPRPIEELNPAISPALGKVVNYMMVKKPEMRYQQASTVIEKLLPFMSPADAQLQPAAVTHAAQMYDAWLAEKLSQGTPQPAAQYGAAPPPQQPQPYAQPPYGQQPGMPQHAAGMNPAQAGYAQAAAPYGAAPQQHPAQHQQPAHQQPAQQHAPAQPQPFAAPSPAAGGGGGAPRAPAPPRIGGASPSIAAQTRRRKSSPVGMIVMVVVLLGGAAAAAFLVPWKDLGTTKPPVAANPSPKPTATGTPRPTGTGPRPLATATATGTPAAAPPKGVVVTARDTMTAMGEPVWESPTAGKALSLNYLTRGVSMVVAFRPAELSGYAETERLLDDKVLGAIGAWMTTTLPSWAGTSAENIEQVIVGLGDGADAVRASYVIHLKTPADEAALAAAWGNPRIEEVDGAKLYVRDDRAFYLPAAGQGKVVVTASKDDLVDSLVMKGAAPPLTARELDFLVQNGCDVERHLTILYTPRFLTSGGKHLVSGTFERGLEPMNWLFTGVGLAPLGDSGAGMAAPGDSEPPKAVAWSAHFVGPSTAAQLFWECRIYQGTVNAAMEGPVGPLAARLQEIPERIESHVLQLPLTPYARKILLKLPVMARFVVTNTRKAVADKQLVLRGYLPDVAAHNLAMGVNLTLLESAGGGTPAAGPVMVAAATPAAAAPQSVLDILRTKKIALSFDRNDLNKVLDIVSQDINVPIEMVGGDFQIAGITKNQSMGLDEPEQTVDKLLQKILLKADMSGRLVYTIKAPAPGQPEMIYIATRDGMASRNEKLLPEFEQPK